MSARIASARAAARRYRVAWDFQLPTKRNHEEKLCRGRYHSEKHSWGSLGDKIRGHVPMKSEHPANSALARQIRKRPPPSNIPDKTNTMAADTSRGFTRLLLSVCGLSRAPPRAARKTPMSRLDRAFVPRLRRRFLRRFAHLQNHLTSGPAHGVCRTA